MEHSACLKMKVETLRALLNDRLTAMVEEICGLFLITIAEYEETRSRSNVAREQQEQPTVPSPALSDGKRYHYEEIKSVLSIKQEQLQESFVLDQNAGEALYIKKEMEDPGTILEGQPNYPFILTDTQQTTTTNQSLSKQQEQRCIQKDKTPRPPHCNEEQETPCTLSEYVKGAEENINSEGPSSSSSSSAQQMEVDGEDCDITALGSDSVKTSNSSDYDTEDSDDDDWKKTPAYQSNFKNAPGSEPNKTLDSKAGIDLQPDSSEPETEDSDDEDRDCSRKRQSGLTTVEPAEVPESSSKSSCQTSSSFSIRGKSDKLKQQVGNKTRLQKGDLTQTKLCFAANLSEASSTQKKLNSPASRKGSRSTSLKKDGTKKLEENPFRCSVCDQTFEKKMYLLLHMKAHKAEREHKTAHPGGSS